jgi:hypothetical protein
MDMSKVMENFDNADPTEGGGNNPRINSHGVHTVKITEVKAVESKTGNEIYLVVEFEVLETNADDVRTGVIYSWVHNLMNKFFGASNAKQFLASALGIDPATDAAKALGQAEMQEAWSEGQPLKGETVKLTTMPKTTKENRPFTVYTWAPAVESE